MRNCESGSHETIEGVEFLHYDFYSQALAKFERGHDRDVSDVEWLLKKRIIDRAHLGQYFETIEADLIRFPAINADLFRKNV